MACDSKTLESLINADGLSKLSQRDLLICLASIYGQEGGFSTSQMALNNAYLKGMSKISDRDLLAAFEAAIC